MYFSSKEILSKRLVQEASIGKIFSDTNLQSIGVHEAAHSLEYTLCLLNPKNHNNVTAISVDFGAKTEATKIVDEAIKSITGYNRVKRKYIKNKMCAEITGQAMMNESEAFAEAFVDCYLHGEVARPLSKEIKRIATERYKKYGGR